MWSSEAETSGEEFQFGLVKKLIDEVKYTFVILQSN